MPARLRALMNESRFALRAVSGVDDALLEQPVLWAHNSDLPDPTPWLDSGGLLLTDGVQFDGSEPTPVAPYVRRLVDHGVLALGFAVGVAHERIPEDLRTAAAAHGLPLVEVPRATPFMGIIRYISDAVAADERLMLETSLRAQRSVARAALRPDGLAEILRELERNLDCWVALFDASGARAPAPTRRGIPSSLAPEVARAVTNMLARGRTAAVRLSIAEGGTGSGLAREVTLQTLGQRGDLRGILAVGTGTGSLDRARADLVDAVIALASIALEQSRTLDDARRRLRSGVLELLMAGLIGVAQRTVTHLWGPLPDGPIRVGTIAPPDDGDVQALRAAMELLAVEHRGALFFAEHDEGIVAIAPADGRAELLALLARHGARAGFSAPSAWNDLGEAVAESQRALARTSTERPVAEFDDVVRGGLLGHLEHTRAHDVARRMLLPLESAQAPPELRRTLEVWLEHNGAWDPAAKALGIHRHTLRARVDGAGALLGLDLETFAARSELWGALQLTRR
ncbi:PucR family transcriptional regulator [Microbacterium sp. 179-I 3D2 NHS]|uniref:PucR family transcriptional regulator n=1 Tax=Microbacterium sp. 179-I 3D2 NHS TaxID=3235178 RepID=UPI00399F6E2D